jgi:4'-phosphopantetheinyl transferase EntD
MPAVPLKKKSYVTFEKNKGTRIKSEPCITLSNMNAAASSTPHHSAAGLFLPGSIPGLLVQEHITVPGIMPVDVHILEFDQGVAVPDAFGQVGMHMPASIARSVKTRQREFLFGRLAARAALSRFGYGESPVNIGPGREPLWPPGFIGSITHCGRHAAACAIPYAHVHGLGVDMEATIGPEAREAVEKLVLLPAERECLQRVRTLPYELVLALAFSAKESFYKAVSAAAGGYFGFETIRIDDIDAASGRIAFTLERTISPAWQQGCESVINFLLLDDDRVLTHFLW